MMLSFSGSRLKITSPTKESTVDGVLEHLRLGHFLPYGEFVRFFCPFHDQAKGRTLWVSRSSGFWGCFSTRCPRHSGGNLRELMSLRGFSFEEAGRIIATLNLQPPKPRTIDGAGNQKEFDEMGFVTEAHVALWQVDWRLVESIWGRIRRDGVTDAQVEQPLETWVHDLPVEAGMVEHDYWLDLGYMVDHRAVTPDALETMSVGFDKADRSIIFPLRTPHGRLVGIARRAPRDGAKAYISGSAYPKDDPNYHKIPVQRGEVLWGWQEQMDRIVRGDTIVVAEGYVDQLKLVASGFCAMAKIGSRLTSAQVGLLGTVPNPVILWPDNDLAGLGAEGVASDLLSLNGRPGVKVVKHFWGRKDAGDLNRYVHRMAVQHAVPPEKFLADLPQLLLRAQRT